MPISGNRSVNACMARADMAMPGRIAPPRKTPSGESRSTVMAVPTSTTTAARPGVRSRSAAKASSRRSMPTMSGRSTSTARGTSPAARSVIASRGRLLRSQSISRVATGRLTLPIHQPVTPPGTPSSHAPSRPRSLFSLATCTASTGSGSGELEIGDWGMWIGGGLEAAELQPIIAHVDCDKRKRIGHVAAQPWINEGAGKTPGLAV